MNQNSKATETTHNGYAVTIVPGSRRRADGGGYVVDVRSSDPSCALSHWTAPESELRVSEATETATAPAAPDPAAVQRAADHISATEISDGNWAHYARETHRWYVVTVAELAELCDYLDHADDAIRQDAYSHWCAGTSAREMPLGWSPDGA